MNFTQYLRLVCDLRIEREQKQAGPKRCSKCLVMKPLTDFAKRTDSTHQSRCRVCQAEYDAKRVRSKVCRRKP